MNILQKVLTIVLCLCMIGLTALQFIGHTLDIKYVIEWNMIWADIDFHKECAMLYDTTLAIGIVGICFYFYFCFWKARKKRLMSILYAIINFILLGITASALFSLSRYTDSPLKMPYLVSYILGYAIPMVLFLVLYTLLWKFKDIRMWFTKRKQS